MTRLCIFKDHIFQDPDKALSHKYWFVLISAEFNSIFFSFKSFYMDLLQNWNCASGRPSPHIPFTDTGILVSFIKFIVIYLWSILHWSVFCFIIKNVIDYWSNTCLISTNSSLSEQILEPNLFYVFKVILKILFIW